MIAIILIGIALLVAVQLLDSLGDMVRDLARWTVQGVAWLIRKAKS